VGEIPFTNLIQKEIIMNYEYIPVAQRNKVKILGFGNAPATNTIATVTNPQGAIPVGTGQVTGITGTVPAGTVNYYGPPIFMGTTERINNVANLTIQTTANNSNIYERHTSKYNRANGITAINILTGGVTYFALEGSGYGMDYPFTGVVTDKELDAIADPYRTAARLTTLGGNGPVSYNHTKAH
jgi:hypothetical protein